ncbi:MAG: hypothetical protein P4M15_01955 [Alphaproteobacteria bacterium]|nr:hypothetical protein [Alphaproteobacteria bacterium]
MTESQERPAIFDQLPSFSQVEGLVNGTFLAQDQNSALEAPARIRNIFNNHAFILMAMGVREVFYRFNLADPRQPDSRIGFCFVDLRDEIRIQNRGSILREFSEIAQEMSVVPGYSFAADETPGNVGLNEKGTRRISYGRIGVVGTISPPANGM